MKPFTFPPIPPDTVRAARAVFGSSNIYLATGDQADHLFEGLIPEEPVIRYQNPIQTVAILYLITVFQFVETLPDRLAADALRKRIDWKYALHLPLNYPGLKPGLLCEFRRWLLREPAGRQNLQTLLGRWSEATDFNAKQVDDLDSSQVIATVCQISRLTNIWETLHQALEALATTHPEWLIDASLPHWYDRYGSHRRNLDLRAADLEKVTLAQKIGADGFHLLREISKSADPELSRLEEILALRELWSDQFDYAEGAVSWRWQSCAGCSLLGLSPPSNGGAI